MPIAREGYPFIAGSALSAIGLWIAAALAGASLLYLAAGILSALSLAMAAFFRDPEREGPSGSDLILAPADGKIVDVARDQDDYVGGPAQRVSIFLSLFDVHVNRYPISGSVEHRSYHPGRFEPAWRRSASHGNERASTGIKGAVCSVLVRQIAGLAAKRIVTYAQIGDSVRCGERMGLIRFGSRVDLYLPPDAQLSVGIGDRTVGGVTVIARLSTG